MSETSPSPLLASPTPDAALLADIGQLYNSRLQIDEIVGLVAKQAAERMAAEAVFFWHDASDGGLYPRGWYGSDPARMAVFDRRFRTFGRPLNNSDPVLAARAGRSTFAPVLARFPGTVDPVWKEMEAASMLVAPIAAARGLIGVLYVLRGEGAPPFTEHELATLEAVAPQAGRAIANATLLAEERWQRQKAELMFQVSKAIHTELNFDQAVREIALLLKQAIRTPWVGLFEILPGDPHPTALRLVGSTAEPGVELRICNAPWSLENWPEAHAVMAGEEGHQTILLPAELQEALGHPEGDWRAFPLAHKLGPQGLLIVSTPVGEHRLRPEAVEVAIAVAELVALAIMNQHLIDQEAKTRIQIIRSQAAAQEREVLLRQIVHDLRNATQAMSLVVEDLEISIGDEANAQAGLSTLNSQISFISNFLKEKLRWIQHGGTSGPDRVSTLADVFADLQARFAPAARARQQRLMVSPPEHIQVALSSVQLEQILGNLLDNAIKYTQPGGEVRLRADFSDGWVTIYVSDDGPGIPTSMQAHLGEVGYRGGNGQVEGAGLGLANVRLLVTQGGGLFGFSSRLQVGTTFHVSLPTTLWGRMIN
ncbi:MAG: Sensory box histidine kinase [Cyanobacteria bacterium RYN_339]|nr:Sensory box histidine kinase [Cyanobacteria bacterium RYN_339]